MKAFHLVGPAPFYTNSFLLISDAGSAVVIDPAAEVQEYDKILKEHGGKLSLILCTHGHYDHVGSAGVLSREWGAKLYCEPADCQGTQLLPLKGSDSGYEEGEVIPLDELRFTVWHTPGHTEGSVVLLCEKLSLRGRHGLSGQHRPHRPRGRRQPEDGREPAQVRGPARPG